MKNYFKHIEMMNTFTRAHQQLADQFTPMSVKITQGLQSGLAKTDPVSRYLNTIDLTKAFPTNLNSGLLSSYERMLPRHSQFLSGLNEQILALTAGGQASAGLNDVRGSMLATWNTGMVGLIGEMGKTGLMARNPALAYRFLAPPKAVADFLGETTTLLAQVSPEVARRHLRAAEFIELQWLEHAALLEETLPTLHRGFDEEPQPLRELTLPRVQRDFFLESADSANEDWDGEAREGPPALTALARRILVRIRECNVQWELRENSYIFKPTSRLLAAYSDLPWMIAQDERSLGDVVDDLYFLLYEAAGKDKLRFHTKGGGPLDDGRCAVIWRIKHLRNKWLRHDVEHGPESGIRKDYRQLSGLLEHFELQRLPTTPGEFQHLHLRIFEEVVAFLDELFEALV